MNFISYLYRKYKISKELFKIKEEMEKMMDFASKLSAKELDQKYDGNFGRSWALLQGEYIKTKEKSREL